ncbi:hypothetical protein LZ554_008493 [Drepanopeziza brunnea f. sp. 'monogermtubi']|nr:hypothetical protein LZ554_008493 [Drepanopeziza brunnea f. sp. 'monogermtubi']
MDRIQPRQIRTGIAPDNASQRALRSRRVGHIIIESIARPTLKRVQHAKPVADLVDRHVSSRRGLHDRRPRQARHGVPIHDTAVKVEGRVTLDDGLGKVTLPAKIVVQIGKEVHVQRGIIPPPRGAHERRVGVEVTDAAVDVEAAADLVVDDPRRVDQAEREAGWEERGAQHVKLYGNRSDQIRFLCDPVLICHGASNMEVDVHLGYVVRRRDFLPTGDWRLRLLDLKIILVCAFLCR